MILGVSFDTLEKNQAFAEKFGFNFPLLSDVDRKVGFAYGATDDPASGANARRVGVIIDPNGIVKFHAPKVSASAFPKEALELI